jgi:hypothetical protein
MIVFGGNNCSSSYFSDVWLLNNANGLGGNPTWSQLSPTGPGPAARALTSAIYDPNTNRMVVFGGSNGALMNDVWVLTNANGLSGQAAWLQLSPGGTAPSPRYGHSAVYDAANNRMIVYGGTETTQKILAETWVLANANGLGGTPTWTLTVPGTGATPQRSQHTAVYDPGSNTMIIFGGKLPSQQAQNCPCDGHVYALDDANGL